MSVETKEWKFDDKSGWPSGEWNSEPDRKQWEDADTGLPCVILRGPMGALCGYVGVSSDHPWFDTDASSCTLPEAKIREANPDDAMFSTDPDSWYNRHRLRVKCCDKRWCGHTPGSHLEVHGGITYSDSGYQDADNPDQGLFIDGAESDELWWFGFDCSHYGDFSPNPGLSSLMSQGLYQDLNSVEHECRQLARQLHEASEAK